MDVRLDVGKFGEIKTIPNLGSNFVFGGSGSCGVHLCCEVVAEITVNKPQHRAVAVTCWDESAIDNAAINLKWELGNILLRREHNGGPESQPLIAARFLLPDHLVGMPIKPIGIRGRLRGVKLGVLRRRVVGPEPIVTLKTAHTALTGFRFHALAF